MRETQFKVLMYMENYVDYNLLGKGIYLTSRPILFNKDTTLELIEEQLKTVRDMSGCGFISEKYFENLKLCELVDVSLLKNYVK